MRKLKKMVAMILCVCILGSSGVLPMFNEQKAKAVQIMTTKNGFSYDATLWDVIWYCSDSFEIYCKNGSYLIGFLNLYSGVAIYKADSSLQTMLIMTEIRPNSSKNTNGTRFLGINNYVQISFNYGKDMLSTSAYAPQATKSTTTIQTGYTISIPKFSAGMVSQVGVPTGGVTIDVDTPNSKTISYRSIKYQYNPITSLLKNNANNRAINLSLSNDLTQTYQFQYIYTGSKKVPLNTYNVEVKMKYVKDIWGYWNGSTTAIQGDSDVLKFPVALQDY